MFEYIIEKIYEKSQNGGNELEKGQMWGWFKMLKAQRWWKGPLKLSRFCQHKEWNGVPCKKIRWLNLPKSNNQAKWTEILETCCLFAFINALLFFEILWNATETWPIDLSITFFQLGDCLKCFLGHFEAIKSQNFRPFSKKTLLAFLYLLPHSIQI